MYLSLCLSLFSFPLSCHFRIFFIKYLLVYPWQFISLSYFLTMCRSFFPLFLFLHLPHYLSFCLPLFHLFDHLSLSLSLSLSLFSLSLCLSVCLSVCLYLCLSLCLSVCLSVSLALPPPPPLPVLVYDSDLLINLYKYFSPFVTCFFYLQFFNEHASMYTLYLCL